ncbi:MAG: NrsF family protein [Polyangia bacterium]
MSIHLEQSAPPPPGDLLRAHLARGGAKKPRRPLRDALVWSLGAAVVAIAMIAASGVRRDLVGVDPRWLGLGLAWALVAVAGAVAAMLPRAGQVLPSARRARFIAAGSVVFLAFVTARFYYDSPLSTRYQGLSALHGIVHCGGLGVLMAAPLVGLAWALVIRRVPISAPIIGAAFGAAAGAASGVVLNTICPVGGQLHALAGHVGVVVLGALLGAASSVFNRR